ncbi:uncharacterized protein Dwil_GK12643 [Drosophila willistoni]|uniref:HP domain-containing protein n=1 Tax=Drosophila willistoni TaxID=7260 RepID=B4N372_DROWI|nr:uncharacterized protein Dwil_GK12643 [Drosophila willistoni]
MLVRAISTVQTSWRPQLPLPKELQLNDEEKDTKIITTTTQADIHNEQEDQDLEMDRLRSNQHHQQQQQHHQQGLGGSHQQLTSKQKWSFGRLFRNNNKKKEAEISASSSEEDRKAGFQPNQRQSAGNKSKTKQGKSSRNSNNASSQRQQMGFDHIVMPHRMMEQQVDNEFFLPLEMQEPYYQNQPSQYYPRSSNSLDRRMLMPIAPPSQHKSRSAQRGGANGGRSSEEEMISLNSSTFSKYRSDESIHSGGQALMPGGSIGSTSGQSRRSRAARNERYYKRLSRDGEQSHGGVPTMPPPQQQQQQRYKTQPLPLSIYQPQQSSGGYVQWQPSQGHTQTKPLQNSMQNDNKRSISYDSHMHLQNINGRMHSKPLPPPPPPRDPLRRVPTQMGSSSGDLRPVSMYSFDHGGGGRCVSDDRIWQPPHYQSVHSLNSQPASQTSSIVSAPTGGGHRRFITRSERKAQPGKQSLPNGIDFHYIADATPRSRKPIHMMDMERMNHKDEIPASSGILRTSKSGLAAAPAPAAALPIAKPRSISSSRLSDYANCNMPMYSEVQKPKRMINNNNSSSQDNVICGSLHIKPNPNDTNRSENYVEIRHKTNSMPHQQQQQRRSGDKYEEYIAEKREQHQQKQPSQQIYKERNQSLPTAAPIYFPRKKPANLEEAINELEAIYKSLGLTEPKEEQVGVVGIGVGVGTVAEKPARIPTPSDFEKFALAHADDYDDDGDSPAGEPDPIRDDVAYRNLQLANLHNRSAVEKQLPFGIPLGPIVPAPQSDYLHVEGLPHVLKQKPKKSGSPDIVKDDLAVRALRKDPPGPKSTFNYPMQKKQRAIRTQSANIYNLIQRDAAKPSGGDLSSYMELSRNIERAGSMTNLQQTSDIPATLDLLRKLKAQEEELNMVKKVPFRHPSLGGAIAQLPERLAKDEPSGKLPYQPVPAPRKSLTPEPILEDALNKIAQDAQASSIKLSHELNELRKEALITAARPKLNAEQQKLEEDLEQIEAVSEAAKRCGQMLLDTLPDANEKDEHPNQQQEKPSRKLHKEGKLIRAIDEVSEAANAVCEKILKDIVTTEPPVVVHEAVQVKQPTTMAAGQDQQQLVMPNLIKKLDPIQSDKIEHIARRCMRQLSELANNPDYDNLSPAATATATATTTTACKDAAQSNNKQAPTIDANNVYTVAEITGAGVGVGGGGVRGGVVGRTTLEEIDHIMQECERQAKSQQTTGNSSSISTDDQRTTAPSMTSGSGSGPNNVSTTASSFSSSSDCLAKSSSSPSNASRPMSSSITSFNPYSSSDYIKSQSSDYQAPSTSDPIKTFSTTSYDKETTPNQTTISTITTTTSNSNSTTNNFDSIEDQTAAKTEPASSPLQLTPKSERKSKDGERASSGASSSPSQYNSSEELAAIFGIEEKPKRHLPAPPTTTTTTGKGATLKPPPCTANVANAANAAITTTTTNIINNNNNNETHLHPLPSNANAIKPNLIDTTSLSTNTDTNTTTNDNCKLETILEQDDCQQVKLSPNFNRIYNSKVRIVVDTEPSTAAVTHCDSLSSLEEISSNPDSGNVSLTDFPLNSQANASLQLQSSYNSRFEVKEHYVSEVAISTTEDDDDDDDENERKDIENMKIEALPILIEEDEDECDSVAQSSRIVYETPQLNLSITELKVNYETKVEQDKEMETVQEATAAVTDDIKTNDHISINDTLASNEQEHKEDAEEEANEDTATRCRKGHPVRHIDANANDVRQQQQQQSQEQPTTSRKALSVFGEQRLVALPRQQQQQQQLAAGGGAAVHLGSGLTTLEHVLVACTVGLITPNDLLTLCLIVIGVIIIIAIALN